MADYKLPTDHHHPEIGFNLFHVFDRTNAGSYDDDFLIELK